MPPRVRVFVRLSICVEVRGWVYIECIPVSHFFPVASVNDRAQQWLAMGRKGLTRMCAMDTTPLSPPLSRGSSFAIVTGIEFRHCHLPSRCSCARHSPLCCAACAPSRTLRFIPACPRPTSPSAPRLCSPLVRTASLCPPPSTPRGQSLYDGCYTAARGLTALPQISI